jgi:hypothetical protein
MTRFTGLREFARRLRLRAPRARTRAGSVLRRRGVALCGASAAVLATVVSGPGAHAHQPHPMGFTELAWRAPHVARVTAALMDFHSGALVLSWRGLGRVERIDGRDCLVGPYFLLDVDDAWAFDVDETVTLRLELARGSGVIASYDHAARSPVALTVPKSFGASVLEIPLERARFANRLFAGSDLALAATGAVYPYSADAEHEIAVCGLTFARAGGERAAPAPKRTAPVAKGRLSLRLLDAAGRPTQARVGLYDASGRMPLPSREAVRVRRYAEDLRQLPVIGSREFWPAPGGYAFYVDGRYSADVPAGEYDLVVMKGPEHRVHRRKVRIAAGARTAVDVRLERWADAPASGWYSGDVHVHVTRAREDNPVVLAHAQAEDLHVTNVLQMGNVVRHHFPQYAFGADGRFARGTHALVAGQESPRSGHRGHTIGLNGSRYHEPKQFFLYHEVAQALRADGGLFGYAHLLQDAFHVARGLALDAPVGLVDFVEILQFGVVATDLYYDMLNLGLRIAPAGGSDYPYIDLPGAARSYVRVPGTFGTDAWFDGLRRGRTFVSNGPLLELEANGAGIGDELRVRSGEPVRIRAKARMNPDLDRLDRIELVVHGKVVASVKSEAGAEQLELAHELRPDAGAWIAVRAYGKGLAAAHTAPVYVLVGDRQETFARERVPALVARYAGLLDSALATEPLPHEDLEHFETGRELARQWREQLPALREHAARARARLEAIRAAAAR